MRAAVTVRLLTTVVTFNHPDRFRADQRRCLFLRLLVATPQEWAPPVYPWRITGDPAVPDLVRRHAFASRNSALSTFDTAQKSFGVCAASLLAGTAISSRALSTRPAASAADPLTLLHTR